MLARLEASNKSLKTQLIKEKEERMSMERELQRTAENMNNLKATADSDMSELQHFKTQLTRSLEGNQSLLIAVEDHKHFREKAEKNLEEVTAELEKEKEKARGLSSENDVLKEKLEDMSEMENVDGAIKQQLDQYASKAEMDANTIEECVEKIQELTMNWRESETKMNSVMRENADLMRELEVTKEKLEASENNLDFGGNKGLRELLTSQGDLANELARLELENESVKKSEQESRSRCEWAENECTKMAQQLVDIRESSEEVAFLEAEEISRLQKELVVAKQETENNNSKFTIAENKYENEIKKLIDEAEGLKMELLRNKRMLTDSKEHEERLLKEVQHQNNFADSVSNRLHALQLNSHAKSVRDMMSASASVANGIDNNLPNQHNGNYNNYYNTTNLQSNHNGNGFFSGLPISTPQSTATATTMSSSIHNKEVAAFSSELESLYQQREAELLAKLADVNAKNRAIESHPYHEHYKKSVRKELQNQSQYLSQQQMHRHHQQPQQQQQQQQQEQSRQEEKRQSRQKMEQQETSPQPTKRSKTSAGGLHSHTASSWAKNSVQIAKSKVNHAKGAYSRLKKGTGSGGGRTPKFNINTSNSGENISEAASTSPSLPAQVSASAMAPTSDRHNHISPAKANISNDEILNPFEEYNMHHPSTPGFSGVDTNRISPMNFAPAASSTGIGGGPSPLDMFITDNFSR